MPETATFPLADEDVRRLVSRQSFDVRRASIREMNNLVNAIENSLGVRFIRMEFGIPGLPTPQVALDAEVRALTERKVSHVYAPFEGVPALKEEIARFAKLFMDLDLPADCCVPTVGAMQGCFASLALAARMKPDARTVLMLDPGFPVNRLQMRFLGVEVTGIDFYDHRGEALVRAIDERAAKGDLCAVMWSSPNNPSWIVLTDDELRGIGEVCDRHGLIAIEDLAYFGMDVRRDYFVPGEPPYQPTVLKHTRNGISIVSSSKIFSYAGQRIAMTLISPELMHRESSHLVERFGTKSIGHALVHGALYPNTACVPESPQYGLLAMLERANAGDRSLFRAADEYARRAKLVKRLFLDAGFRLVYDNDLGEPLADGFYFTIAYPGYDHGADLLMALLHYGISAITLETTGSSRIEGLRACVSLIGDEQIDDLRERLAAFRRDHATD